MSRKILLYTSGTLGDMLVLIPVFSAVRKQNPDAHIVLMNKHESKLSSPPAELIRESGFADEVMTVGESRMRKNRLLAFLRWPAGETFDEVYYLIRDGKSLAGKLRRDMPYFRRISRSGIVRGDAPSADLSDPHAEYPRIGELVLRRINRNSAEPLAPGPYTLSFSPAEQARAMEYYESFGFPGGSKPFIVCVGGKTQVSRWPLEKYAELLNRVTDVTDGVPVFLGGEGDREAIGFLRSRLPAGKSFHADKLSSNLRESICFMSLFPFYLGNDTGSIHMAAAAGLRCIGVTSSHDPRGLWRPYGENHLILRTDPECTGCRKTVCGKSATPCVDSISVLEVFAGVRLFLGEADSPVRGPRAL